ncbi:MAG: hypothetical protein ACO1QR_15215 [Chthoniobacteraceae bacterium]
MATNGPTPKKRWLRRVLIGGAVLVVLAIVSAVGLKLWADHYLRSDSFRHFVSTKLSKTLRADTELAPFQYQGLTVFSDRLTARGRLRAPFARLEMDHIRAEFSTDRIWDGAWYVEHLEVARVEMDLEGTRAVEPPSTEQPKGAKEPEKRSSWRPAWIPNRVEVGSTVIKDATLAWKEGSLSGAELQMKPSDGGWEIGGTGGRIAHSTLPKLELEKLRLRYNPPFLYVQEVDLREGSGAKLNLTGEIELNERLDLLAKVNRLPLGPLLPEDWRARLHGNLSGEVSIQSDLPAKGTPQLAGTVFLTEGTLEALPVLDQIAIFTRTAQFRRIALTKTEGSFTRDDRRLTVKNFIAESAGLIRIEGDFQVEEKNIDGTFQVGVTPSSLQWLPGSQARVFTVARDGYLWTPMRLTGPLEEPEEDLSPRLIAAAQGAIIDKATDTARDVIDSATDAAKSVLDRLFGK